MKVCIVSKFPPIEGGIAAKTYWLARGYAEAGLEVHVVTNAQSVEEEYRIGSCSKDYRLPRGVYVHNIDRDTPWHIPNSPLYQEKLLDKVIKVCTSNRIDLIDSFYLVPYGIVAFLAGKILGIPYIIRHGGSDVAKFWKQGVLKELLKKVLKEAAAVVSDNKDFFSLNKNVIDLPLYVPDERYFNPLPEKQETPVFAYVGKINFYWRHKGLQQIIDFWCGLSFPSTLLFLAQGKGKPDFLRRCTPEMVQFFDFIPPWEMPSFLQKIDYLFYLVGGNPIPHFSNVVVEAVACGGTIITDKPAEFSRYQSVFDVHKYVLPLQSFHHHRRPPFNDNPIKICYGSYIQSNINLYREVAGINANQGSRIQER